jgi:hypothetical protein
LLVVQVFFVRVLRGRVGVAHLVLAVVVGGCVMGMYLARELGNADDSVSHKSGAVGKKENQQAA